MAKQRPALLQIDVDAAEGDAADGHALLVGPQRRIERGQEHVRAGRPQGGGQRVAMQATAAIHRAGAGGKVDDFHAVVSSQLMAGRAGQGRAVNRWRPGNHRQATS